MSPIPRELSRQQKGRNSPDEVQLNFPQCSASKQKLKGWHRTNFTVPSGVVLWTAADVAVVIGDARAAVQARTTRTWTGHSCK